MTLRIRFKIISLEDSISWCNDRVLPEDDLLERHEDVVANTKKKMLPRGEQLELLFRNHILVLLCSSF